MYILSGGQDKLIHLFNTQAGTHVASFDGCAWQVLDVAVAPDGNTFISGGGDKALFLWDVSTHRILRRFPGNIQQINTVAYGAGGSIVAAGSYDCTVRLWDVRGNSRFPVAVLDEATDSVSSLQIHQQHDILTGSIDGHTRLYDLRKGALLTDNIQHPVTAVRFTQDAQAFLTASLDSTIRLMDRPTGTLLNSYQGHRATSYQTGCHLFHHDSFVVAGSEDGLLHLWDLLSAKLVRQLAGHRRPISKIAIHPTGRSILTCALDGTLRLWE